MLNSRCNVTDDEMTHHTNVHDNAHAAQPRPSPEASLGQRVKALRVRHELSQRELAKRSGLAHATISQIENNRVSPSVASLRMLVGALGVSLAEFFGPDTEAERSAFFGASDLVEVGTGSLSLRLVGAQIPGRTLQVLHETYAPGADTGVEMLEHDGEEAGVVVAGRVTVTVGDETRVLERGDAYQFASSIPHRFRNEGDEVCEIVSASTPPTF